MTLIDGQQTDVLQLGDSAPDFNLLGVDGQDHTLSEFADKDVLVVGFICNHCPYVKAYIDRLVEIQRDYSDKQIQIVGINSNDEINYPEDDFENMKSFAQEKGINFPYLRDESQETAHEYGALCTPHLYMFNKERKLVWMGRVDENWEYPDQVKNHYLRDAIDSVLEGKEIENPGPGPIGCSIKWKEEI